MYWSDEPLPFDESTEGGDEVTPAHPPATGPRRRLVMASVAAVVLALSAIDAAAKGTDHTTAADADAGAVQRRPHGCAQQPISQHCSTQHSSTQRADAGNPGRGGNPSQAPP